MMDYSRIISVCDGLLAKHGQVDLADQEGHEEVDADGNALGGGAGLNSVHL